MKKRQRLTFALLVLACLGVSVCLSLYALRDNVSFFYTPSDIKRLKSENPAAVAPGQRFRLGGLVQEKSVRRDKKSAAVAFDVTDGDEQIHVIYTGILPDLFREKQGVVATGSLTETGAFNATEILAKHDENYKPPALQKALGEKK